MTVLCSSSSTAMSLTAYPWGGTRTDVLILIMHGQSVVSGLDVMVRNAGEGCNHIDYDNDPCDEAVLPVMQMSMKRMAVTDTGGSADRRAIHPPANTGRNPAFVKMRATSTRLSP